MGVLQPVVGLLVRELVGAERSVLTVVEESIDNPRMSSCSGGGRRTVQVRHESSARRAGAHIREVYDGRVRVPQHPRIAARQRAAQLLPSGPSLSIADMARRRNPPPPY